MATASVRVFVRHMHKLVYLRVNVSRNKYIIVIQIQI